MSVRIDDGLSKAQRWRRRHPEKVKANRDLQNARRAEAVRLNPGLPHGLTREEYDALLPLDGLCPICQTVPRFWVVDHDHRCCAGSKGCAQCVRGVVCKPCNSALGHLREDPAVIQGLLSFLQTPPTRRLSRLGG